MSYLSHTSHSLPATTTRHTRLALSLLAALLITPLFSASAGPLTRAEALTIAEAYCNYHWTATAKNVLQGRDIDGVEVHTPNYTAPNVPAAPNLWSIDTENTGVPYKWGGFDSLETFEAGIKKGKAAGDHVIMFARWLDDEKSRAQFYEASPYCKVISSSYNISALTLSGFQPWRYKQIRD